MNHLAKLTCIAIALAGTAWSMGQQPVDSEKEPKPPLPLPDGAVVYHTLTGRDAQVVFTSDAPLERIIGKSNKVVGYAIPGPKDHPAKLAGAKWILPVRSLATGIPLRDDHLVAKEWLHADVYPNIEFTLTRVEDIKKLKAGEGFTTWSVTLIGDMCLHGVKREIRVADARLSFFQASERTKAIAPGDLIFLKCDYSVRMSEFGIKHVDVPKKVSDEVKLSQMLRLSTIPPHTDNNGIVSDAPENAQSKTRHRDTADGSPRTRGSSWPNPRRP